MIEQPNDLQFLQAIFRENTAFAHVTQFPDPPDNVPNDRRGIAWGGRWLKDQAEWPAHGNNTYFTISIFNPDPETGRAVRRKEQFLATYVIVADDVKEKLDEARVRMLPEPSYKLVTSYNHVKGLPSEQWGWILQHPCADRNVVDNLLDGLVAKGLAPDGKDPGMRGVTRYVRTPGGWNTKDSKRDPATGEAFKCYLSEWNPERMVSIEDLAATFGIDLYAKRRDSGAYAGDAAWGSEAPVSMLIEQGLVEILKDKGDGRYDIVCPWVEEHSDGDTSGTELRMKEDGTGAFKCHHGCCENRTFVNFLKHYNVDALHDQWRKSTFGTGDLGRQSLDQIFKDVPVSAPQHQAPPKAPAFAEPEAPDDDAIRTWISYLGQPNLSDLKKICAALVEAFPYMNELQRDVAAKDLHDQFNRAGTVKIFKDAIRKAKQHQMEERKRVELQQAQLVRAQADGATEYRPLSAMPGEIAYPFPSPSAFELAPAMMHAENLKALCKHHGIGIRYNIMTHGMEITIPGLNVLSDERDNLNLYYLEDIAKASNMASEGMQKKVLQVAQENAYHPVLSWLDSLDAWDGQDYIKQVCGVLTTPTQDILEKYLRNWMRQGIVAARATYGDAPPRNVLVFSGAQYKGKTTFFRLLSPPIDRAFRDGLHLDPSDKDSLKKSIVSFIVELGELDSTFRKSDMARLKAHIASGEDMFRLPYAATEVSWARRTIYCATVNDEEFLIDPTGNTRWNAIQVNDVNLDEMRRLVDEGIIAKAWKQAEAEVDAGVLWWFKKSEVEALEQHLDQFRRVSSVEDALDSLFDWEAPHELWQPLRNHEIAEAVGVDHRSGHGVASGVKAYLKSRGVECSGKVKVTNPDGSTTSFRGFKMPPRRHASGKMSIAKSDDERATLSFL